MPPTIDADRQLRQDIEATTRALIRQREGRYAGRRARGLAKRALARAAQLDAGPPIDRAHANILRERAREMQKLARTEAA